HDPPVASCVKPRHHEWNGLVVRVEHDQEVVVPDGPAARIDARDHLSREIDTETAAVASIPVLARHLPALRREPGDFLDAGFRLSLQKARAAEDGMLPPQLDHPRHEL